MNGCEKRDLVFKLIIIGDSSSGKSCLMRQFVDARGSRSISHTVGVEFSSKTVEIGQTRLQLHIWDTAGQERFRSVTRSYYRNAAGCLLVFDITSRESFEHAGNWLRDARTLASPDTSIVLVGNKLDLRHQRQVSVVDASRYAQENDMMFLEASAVSGEGVDECFLKVCRTVLSKIESGIINLGADAPVQLADGTDDVSSSRTCCH
uniref:Uncharacterized protein n=1 Tax=Coccolithus braarudii TaxID=221442 RepID=A0A7S0Q8P1_9EUKA|mmetsp:Transcript_5507/g.12152  ORF Transcript_5507/g.12152 Transcript_5507/m.12152 type:complete len:206 (+) Transcript_5507:1-618(+)